LPLQYFYSADAVIDDRIKALKTAEVSSRHNRHNLLNKN